MQSYKPKLSEMALKRQVKDYLDIKHIFSYAILQGLGSHPGLPDRTMHFNGQVIYLELKTVKGKLSPAQQIFKEQCESDGIPYLIIRNIEELQRILE